MERLPLAESFEPYHSVREGRYSYYRIYVDNYIIYYVVIDDDPNDLLMEVISLQFFFMTIDFAQKRSITL